MFFSHTPKSRMRYVLVFGITALVIVSPATETPASQKDDPREHPPKLLNYSKMTTPHASRAAPPVPCLLVTSAPLFWMVHRDRSLPDYDVLQTMARLLSCVGGGNFR